MEYIDGDRKEERERKKEMQSWVEKKDEVRRKTRGKETFGRRLVRKEGRERERAREAEKK